MFDDEYFMRTALREAEKAMTAGEVPIGAVVVAEGRIIARAHNQTEMLRDPTAHAEMLAITSACNMLGAKYLTHAALYVTVEPCLMCAGATLLSQVGKVIIGCRDNRRGYSQYVSEGKHVFHAKALVVENILEQECSDLMKTFFQSKRI